MNNSALYRNPKLKTHSKKPVPVKPMHTKDIPKKVPTNVKPSRMMARKAFKTA